jgi:hypothetical protein
MVFARVTEEFFTSRSEFIERFVISIVKDFLFKEENDPRNTQSGFRYRNRYLQEPRGYALGASVQGAAGLSHP